MSSINEDSSQRESPDPSFKSESIGRQENIAKDPGDASTMETRQEISPVHNVGISLTGNYSVLVGRKGNTRLSFDKDSLSGALVLDGGSKSETRLPLAIRKFKISKNLKRISYAASVQSERLAGKVSGRLRFQNPIDIATPDDQVLLPKQKSSLKIIVSEPLVTAKKGSRGKIEFNQSGQAAIPSQV